MCASISSYFDTIGRFEPMQITLIVPCYNEEANFQKGVLDKVGNYTKDHPLFAEVLIADDGSTDATAQIIKDSYAPLFPKFKLLSLPHGGKANTVIAAVNAAQSPYVLFTDADLATPIEEAEKLIERQIATHAPVVIGSRGVTRPDAPLTRKIMALGMISLRSILFGLRSVKDTQCGFKLFERSVAVSLFSKLLVFKKKKVGTQASVSAIFDLEFLFLARKFGHRIEEVHVSWRHVETKRVSFIKDVVESLIDIARLKWYDICGKYQP